MTIEEREKAVKFIHAYMHPTSDSEFEQKKLLYRDMAIEALEQTMWIPVSEKLPKIGTKVLCSVNDHGGYYVIITLYNVQDYWSNGIITAWMPLPEPYKVEGEDMVGDIDGRND